MKKILALIMVIVVCFSMLLTACAPKDPNNGDNNGGDGQEEVLQGEGTGENQQPEDGNGDTLVPSITDGGIFDGNDY